jgi:hypothetical protein
MLKSLIKSHQRSKKARARFGDAFNEQEFVTTNARVMEYKARGEILERMARSLGNEFGRCESINRIRNCLSRIWF